MCRLSPSAALRRFLSQLTAPPTKCLGLLLILRYTLLVLAPCLLLQSIAWAAAGVFFDCLVTMFLVVLLALSCRACLLAAAFYDTWGQPLLWGTRGHLRVRLPGLGTSAAGPGSPLDYVPERRLKASEQEIERRRLALQRLWCVVEGERIWEDALLQHAEQRYRPDTRPGCLEIPHPYLLSCIFVVVAAFLFSLEPRWPTGVPGLREVPFSTPVIVCWCFAATFSLLAVWSYNYPKVPQPETPVLPPQWATPAGRPVAPSGRQVAAVLRMLPPRDYGSVLKGWLLEDDRPFAKARIEKLELLLGEIAAELNWEMEMSREHDMV